MKKKDFFCENEGESKSINEYFYEAVPVNFSKITCEYNFKLIGMDFDIIEMSRDAKEFEELKNMTGHIAGLVDVRDENRILYYNNNIRFDGKEQRFILANLISYCKRMQNIGDKKSVVKSFDIMLKCDTLYDDMTEEEANEYFDNANAREILMPEKQFKHSYTWLNIIPDLCEEQRLEFLSYQWCVPIREVQIRCKELGLVHTDDCKKGANGISNILRRFSRKTTK